MMKMKKILEKYLDKNVFILLKGGYKYNGKIISINDDILEFKDKFGNDVYISIDNISVVNSNGDMDGV